LVWGRHQQTRATFAAVTGAAMLLISYDKASRGVTNGARENANISLLCAQHSFYSRLEASDVTQALVRDLEDPETREYLTLNYNI